MVLDITKKQRQVSFFTSKVAVVKALFDTAKDRRKARDDEWRLLWDWYSGNQFKMAWPDDMSQIVVNHCHRIVETILPLMTDLRPRPVVMPRNRFTVDVAKVLDRTVEQVWKENDLDVTLQEPLRDSLITGTGFLKVGWDRYGKAGLGQIFIDAVPTHQIYPDPSGTNIDDLNYIFHRTSITLPEALYRYPEHWSQLMKQSGIEPDIELGRALVNGYRSPIRNTMLLDTNVFRQDTTIYESPQVLVGGGDIKNLQMLELWIKDESFRELERELPKEEQVATVERIPMFPTGRVIRIIGDELVYDGRNIWNNWPIIPIYDHKDSRSFWGRGEIEPILGLQDAANKITSQIVNILNLTGNPAIIFEKACGLKPRDFINVIGKLLPVNRGFFGRVGYMSPGNIPVGAFEAIITIQRMIDDVSGVRDLSKSVLERELSGEALQTALDAAETRIRNKTRNLGWALKRTGEITLDAIQRYYTGERIIRTVGDSEIGFMKLNERMNKEDAIKRMTEEEGVDKVFAEEMVLEFQRRQLDRNRIKDATEVILNDPQVDQFDVELQLGSTSPIFRQARASQALRLAEMNFIDQRALLDALDYTDRERIISRMAAAAKRQLEMMQQLQGQQQAQGAPQSASA